MNRIALDQGWQLSRGGTGPWVDAAVPGTVASALQADLDNPERFDTHEWTYRVTFAAPQAPRCYLRLDGLATLAEVFLNGEKILESRNMFRGHRVDVGARLKDVNQLAIRFLALDQALAARRPRPRWRTQLVDSQNLRWFRTTLLGRMPGWTPAVTAVGPWQPIYLECADPIDVASADIEARLEEGRGRVHVRAQVSHVDGQPIEAARLRLGEAVHELHVLQSQEARIHGEVVVENPPAWFPHTHGEPRLVDCALEVRVQGRWIVAHERRVGFRHLAMEASEGRLRLRVNGVPVFCRGAVWTTMDIRTLRADRAALRETLLQARDAGLNMLRVGGTMHYESDDFYALCDELGILVWQDFMFANMDYPVADAAFRAEIEAEARYQVARLKAHPCIAAYCGGSEIAQQAAMVGLPAAQWSNEFFTGELPRLVAQLHFGTPYFPSTPWGGALPFHVASGIAHYYGVGAYRRPLADAKTARVKFTTECLGFANVPDAATTAEVLGREDPPPHHPRWKARLPRDPGVGWDFEDVRDHYLRELFGCDPVALRSQDLERYWRLSRVASGEVMRRTFAEWRTPWTRCGGALVWNFRDLWPGAGWGLTDSHGRFKPALWFLKRAWATRGVYFTDEGLDGLAAHVVNESATPFPAMLEIAMYRDGRVQVAHARTPLEVPARATITRHVDALVGYFTDTNNAYRFGPPKHDVVVARLVHAETGEALGEDFHFPLGLDLPPRPAAVTSTVQVEPGLARVTLSTDAFLQAIEVTAPGYLPSDNYFHLAPGYAKTLVFQALEDRPFAATLQPLNVRETLRVSPSPLAHANSDRTRASS
jgi:beta-mannosidase